MTKSNLLFLGAFLLIALAMPRSAMAQLGYNSRGGGYFGGHSDNPNGPTVSPYLNLLQTNSQGFSSYQTNVKPFIDQQNAINRQGNALQQLQSQVNSPAYSSGARQAATGHSTFYLNYSHYYSIPRQQR